MEVRGLGNAGVDKSEEVSQEHSPEAENLRIEALSDELGAGKAEEGVGADAA